MSLLSEAAKEAYATARSDLSSVQTLQIYHPSFGNVYLVQSFTNQTFTLETSEVVEFEAGGFEVALPTRDGRGVQDLSIVIDNTDRRVSQYITQALEDPTTPIEVTHRTYLSNDFTQPLNDPPLKLSVVQIKLDLTSVSLTATFADFLNKPFPNQIYTKTRFPAL